MTTLQKLMLRLSEIRSKLNELSGQDSPTAEQLTEMEALGKEFQDKETQYRAAVIAEGEKTEGEGREFQENGEGAEIRAIKGKCSVIRYLDAASKGAGLAGPEAELNDALEVRAGGGVRIPWTMLLSESEAEVRVDVATTTGALEGGRVQRPVLRRLFGRSVLEALGIRLDSVPAGMSEWPLLTGTAAPAQKAESAKQDAAAATFSTIILKPKRLTGRYIFTAEMVAQIPGVEEALRRDLADAVMAEMSKRIIIGTGAAPDVKGFLGAASNLTAAMDPGSASTYEDFASAAAEGVDGIHASMETEVCIVLGDDSYRAAAKLRASGSSDFATDGMKRKSMLVMASSFIPDPASDIQEAILHARGMEAGGEMRGDSVASVWPSLELIRDIYTKAGEGETILTWNALWDAETAFRSAAYKRIKFHL